MANKECSLTKFRRLINQLSSDHNASIEVIDDIKLKIWHHSTIKIKLNGMLDSSNHYLIFEISVVDTVIWYCIWKLYPNSNCIPLMYHILNLSRIIEDLNYAFEQLTCWANYDSNKNAGELFD